jgi:hypothetical protein
LLGSSIVVVLASNWRRPLIHALTVAAFVLVIPAGFIAYQSGLHFVTWLPSSARARIILWEYTAEQALTHPLLGKGVESTPVLSKQQMVASPSPAWPWLCLSSCFRHQLSRLLRDPLRPLP